MSKNGVIIDKYNENEIQKLVDKSQKLKIKNIVLLRIGKTKYGTQNINEYLQGNKDIVSDVLKQNDWNIVYNHYEIDDLLEKYIRLIVNSVDIEPSFCFIIKFIYCILLFILVLVITFSLNINLWFNHLYLHYFFQLHLHFHHIS